MYENNLKFVDFKFSKLKTNQINILKLFISKCLLLIQIKLKY